MMVQLVTREHLPLILLQQFLQQKMLVVEVIER